MVGVSTVKSSATTRCTENAEMSVAVTSVAYIFEICGLLQVNNSDDGEDEDE